jgi:inhibitor of KinA
MKPECMPLGECALIMRWGNAIDAALNEQLVGFARHLQAEPLPGLREAAAAYCSLVVRYEPRDLQPLPGSTGFHVMALRLNERWLGFRPQDIAAPKHIQIPVRYGGEDLAALAISTGLGETGVIEAHTAREYRVYLMGFLPGFGYLGDVDERIAAPRHSTPRLRVEAGSVGIAGRQTGVYPMASPGGWQIIGRTERKLFDPSEERPVLLEPGDRVRFVAI